MKLDLTVLPIILAGLQLSTIDAEELKENNLRGRKVQQYEYSYLLKTPYNNGQCVTTGSEGKVYLSDCSGGSNQKWSYQYNELKNEEDGKCLSASTNDGSIAATTCYGFGNENWTLKDGSFIASYNKEVCMNIDMNDGFMDTDWCHHGINQQFELEYHVQQPVLPPLPPVQKPPVPLPPVQIPSVPLPPVQIQPPYVPPPLPIVPDNSLFLVLSETTLCVAMSLDNGNDVTGKACEFSREGDKQKTNEKWIYDLSTKLVKNAYDPELCLDADITSDPDFFSIGVWKCHGRDNQKFVLNDDSQFTSYGKCLKMNWNGELSLHNCNDSQRQKFDLIRGSQIQEPYFKPIYFSAHDNTCVSMSPFKVNGKHNVYIQQCNGRSYQNWWINTEDKTILNDYNNYCLDVDQGADNNIITWECHGKANQEFVLDNFDRIRSEINKNCVSKNLENDLVLDGCLGGDNQEFSYDFEQNTEDV